MFTTNCGCKDAVGPRVGCSDPVGDGAVDDMLVVGGLLGIREGGLLGMAVGGLLGIREVWGSACSTGYTRGYAMGYPTLELQTLR